MGLCGEGKMGCPTLFVAPTTPTMGQALSPRRPCLHQQKSDAK